VKKGVLVKNTIKMDAPHGGPVRGQHRTTIRTGFGRTGANFAPQTANIGPHYRKFLVQPPYSATESPDRGEKSWFYRSSTILRAHLSRQPRLAEILRLSKRAVFAVSRSV
jgi:hypothetical protein